MTTTRIRIGTPAVAGQLGVSDETVRQEIQRDRLPAIRVGRTYRVLQSDVDAYIAAAANVAVDDGTTRFVDSAWFAAAPEPA